MTRACAQASRRVDFLIANELNQVVQLGRAQTGESAPALPCALPTRPRPPRPAARHVPYARPQAREPQNPSIFPLETCEIRVNASVAAGDKKDISDSEGGTLHHSCEQCRAAKTACTDTRPCARCVRLHMECTSVCDQPRKRACVACRKAKVTCDMVIDSSAWGAQPRFSMLAVAAPGGVSSAFLRSTGSCASRRGSSWDEALRAMRQALMSQ